MPTFYKTPCVPTIYILDLHCAVTMQALETKFENVDAAQKKALKKALKKAVTDFEDVVATSQGSAQADQTVGSMCFVPPSL